MGSTSVEGERESKWLYQKCEPTNESRTTASLPHGKSGMSQRSLRVVWHWTRVGGHLILLVTVYGTLQEGHNLEQDSSLA